jgi:serine/threonine protein kinase
VAEAAWPPAGAEDPLRVVCPTEERLLAFVGAGERESVDEALLAHLDGCDECRAVVAEATRSLVAGGGAHRGPSGTQSLAIGDRVVDRYEIRRFIARGGMGEVYEAHDPLLDERVALKTLAATTLDDDGAAFRFRAEARLARRVTHVNVCRILEFGVHARGLPGVAREALPFLTMEFLSGETLAARVARSGRMTIARAAPLIEQILAGLKAIHDVGIVHRDLKSENVFLVPESRGDRVVLMDFGLARALDGSVVSTLPHQKRLVGTMETMAPEQIEGGRVGVAADVFAFGALLFEILTGRRPFAGVPPHKRVRSPAPDPRAVAPDLDPRWAAIITRCLAPSPGDRFADLEQLRAALPRSLRHAGAREAGAHWRRRMTLLLLVSTLLVGAIAFALKALR